MSGAVAGEDVGGTLAAVATPMREGGERLDLDAVPALDAWLRARGIDGVLVGGTTGEGILLDAAERRALLETHVAAAAGMTVVAHCGAQTTRDTAALAAHAAAAGAAAVAVIAPPYFALDQSALLRHLLAAAQACAPLPFFLYEFAARSGYAVAPATVLALRDAAPNLCGLKVSDTPWERFEPYLIEGLRVLAGPESLIHRALAAGAVGAVSGLATALPEPVVRAVRERTEAASARAGELRRSLDAAPFHAAVKHVLVRRGVLVGAAVRAPLRELTEAERGALDARLAPVLAELDGVTPSPR